MSVELADDAVTPTHVAVSGRVRFRSGAPVVPHVRRPDLVGDSLSPRVRRPPCERCRRMGIRCGGPLGALLAECRPHAT
jgi:hypothetical protein